MIANFRKHSVLWSVAAALVMTVLGCAGLTNAPSSPYVKAKFDRPFVSDPAVLGRWDSVDFVNKIEDFTPGKKVWAGSLFLRTLTFKEGGKTTGPWTWTQGTLWHPGDRTEAQYVIKTIGGQPYLFMEWISGDVIYRGRKPLYYVLKKTAGSEAEMENVKAGENATGTAQGLDAATSSTGKAKSEVRPTASLTITGFKVLPYPEGGLFQLVVSVKNTGTTANPNFDIAFYRNAANRLSPMNYGGGPIKPGDVWNEATLPFALKEGVNRMAVELDPLGQLKMSTRERQRAVIEATVKSGKVISSRVTYEKVEPMIDQATGRVQ